jgi:bacillaene synthase trans-acting acyltransferase
MEKRVVFMFSGQGSQYYQMGRELYEKHEMFKYWMDYCNKIVTPLIHTSLIDVLYSEKTKGIPFDEILYTNPALLCIGYSMSKTVQDMGFQPDCVLGYSLGEMIASVVSGAISLEDGIRMVVGLAKLVTDKTQQAEMLAILETKKIILNFPDLFERCWITATNFQNNFVVSGLPIDIQRLQKALSKINVTSQLLPVCYGFHSKLIDPIEGEFRFIAQNIKISPNTIPIVSSRTADVIDELNEEHFWEVIRYPVNFELTIVDMLKRGNYTFIDLGPSGSLATIVKNILPPASPSISIPILNQFGRDLSAIERLQSSLCL